MKRLILLFAMCLTCSCGLSEIGGESVSGNASGSIWGGPLKDNVGSLTEQKCYMTALDYKKGYDWRADYSKESVKCSLVVYVDGKPVMKVPVGEQYEISADPDMHRMIDGHLYTDYSTDSETVVRKDGIQLFRYQGRESVCGMYVIDEDLFLLGRNRDGNGFTLRKNGEVVFSRETGAVLGTLKNIGDTLSFAFYDTILASDGNVERYYLVRNCEVTQMAVRDDIRRVWDISCTETSVIYIASVIGLASPVLFNGEIMTALQIPGGAVLLYASIISEGDRPIVEMIYRKGNLIFTSLWCDGATIRTFAKGMTISSSCVRDGDVFCALNPQTANSVGTIFRGNEMFAMPSGYSCISSNSVSVVNGIMHVGLSSMSGGKPLIWKDGLLDTLNINGYISSVAAY